MNERQREVYTDYLTLNKLLRKIIQGKGTMRDVGDYDHLTQTIIKQIEQANKNKGSKQEIKQNKIADKLQEKQKINTKKQTKEQKTTKKQQINKESNLKSKSRRKNSNPKKKTAIFFKELNN